MNLAMDIEINDILVNIEKMDMPMSSIIGEKTKPDNLISGFAPDEDGNFTIIQNQKKYIIKCRNKSSIEIYDELWDILKKPKTKQKKNLPLLPNVNSSISEPQGDSNLQEDRNTAEQNESVKNKSNSNCNLPVKSSQSPSGNSISLPIEIPSGFDDHNIGKLSDSERIEEEAKWGETLIGADVYQESVNPEKKRSANGSWYQRYIDKILKPQVDWRAVLRKHLIELIPFNYTYNIPARKSYAINVYEPKILRKPLGVTVCIDVSGSISEKELQEFLSEVVGVAKAASEISIRRLYWSTEVDTKNDEVFTRKNLRQLFTTAKNIHSTGGTMISCVQKYLEKHRDRKTENLIIYLTDGYVEKPPLMCKKSLVVISENGTENIFQETKIPFVKMKKR